MSNSGMNLSVQAEWKETLEEDFITILGKIGNTFQQAVNYASPEMKYLLDEHIRKDVYDRWNPTEYIRRYENGLLNLGNGDFIRPHGASLTPDEVSLSAMIRYAPDGESEQWEHPAEGDDLIRRIESGNGYEWKKHPGPRPFWTKYVEDMIEGNKLADAISMGMANAGLEVEGFLTVERESGDGDYA